MREVDSDQEARVAQGHAQRAGRGAQSGEEGGAPRPDAPGELERQREARLLEGKRDEAWRDFDQASREIDRQKDTLLDDMSRHLQQTVGQSPLFTIRWRLT